MLLMATPTPTQARLALMHSLAWRRQHYLSHLAEWVPPPLLSQYFPGGWTDTDKGTSSLFFGSTAASSGPSYRGSPCVCASAGGNGCTRAAQSFWRTCLAEICKLMNSLSAISST